MYTKWFFLDKALWNNSFSYDKRKNKKLYIPNIIKIKNFEEIKLQDDIEKIAFEDFDFDWNLSTNYGLKNFYRIPWKDKEIILVDNHNHVFYFWYEARKNWIITNGSTLYHIDEHSDLKDNKKYISKTDSKNLKKVFEFTNYSLNVWDYIIPAKNEWLIDKIIEIRNSYNIDSYLKNPIKNKNTSIILNLDLDFFEPNLDYIDYEIKKKVILDIAKKADIITISSSPFFIDQNLAIEVFKDLFN